MRRIGVEVRKRLQQEVLPRHEIRIEDRHVFAAGGDKSLLERTGLESLPVRAAYLLDVVPELPVALDILGDHIHGLVRGIIQHLDLELVLRIDHGTGGIDQAADHVDLVEDRQLDGHDRICLHACRQQPVCGT